MLKRMHNNCRIRRLCTSENVNMEKQSTESGLNLYLWASKNLAGAETSMFCAIFKLLFSLSAESDCLSFEDVADISLLRFSWLGIAPAFLQISTIFGCLNFSTVSEFAEWAEAFFLFFFLFWETGSLPLRRWLVFSKSHK